MANLLTNPPPPPRAHRPWEDPLPEAGERHLAQELRGVGLGTYEMPDWKNAALGKAPTFGINDARTMKEQRESLPIFKLRDQLVQAVHDNQVLVVIGETGSGKTTQVSCCTPAPGRCIHLACNTMSCRCSWRRACGVSLSKHHV